MYHWDYHLVISEMVDYGTDVDQSDLRDDVDYAIMQHDLCCSIGIDVYYDSQVSRTPPTAREGPLLVGSS